jgi:hypothetical protein
MYIHDIIRVPFSTLVYNVYTLKVYKVTHQSATVKTYIALCLPVPKTSLRKTR